MSHPRNIWFVGKFTIYTWLVGKFVISATVNTSIISVTCFFSLSANAKGFLCMQIGFCTPTPRNMPYPRPCILCKNVFYNYSSASGLFLIFHQILGSCSYKFALTKRVYIGKGCFDQIYCERYKQFKEKGPDPIVLYLLFIVADPDSRIFGYPSPIFCLAL